MWTYAMAHPILFFMMVCFVTLIGGALIEGVVVNTIKLIASIISTKNN